MAFIYLKYALGFRICCLPYIMLWLLKYSVRIDIISRAILETFFILVFRLADLLALSRTAPYSRLLFGCWFCQFEPNSYLDPWQLGLVPLFSLGYKHRRFPACAEPLDGQRGPPSVLSESQGDNPWTLWNNQPLTTRIEQKKEASRSSVSPFKRK